MWCRVGGWEGGGRQEARNGVVLLLSPERYVACVWVGVRGQTRLVYLCQSFTPDNPGNNVMLHLRLQTSLLSPWSSWSEGRAVYNLLWDRVCYQSWINNYKYRFMILLCWERGGGSVIKVLNTSASAQVSSCLWDFMDDVQIVVPINTVL